LIERNLKEEAERDLMSQIDKKEAARKAVIGR